MDSGKSTGESFLMWNGEVFLFKMRDDDEAPAVLTEAAIEKAIVASTGDMREIFVFLVEAARKTPGKWASASARPLTPGQGTI